jgi:hypothetical protein
LTVALIAPAIDSGLAESSDDKTKLLDRVMASINHSFQPKGFHFKSWVMISDRIVPWPSFRVKAVSLASVLRDYDGVDAQGGSCQLPFFTSNLF